MSVVKVTEIKASSPNSFEDAIQEGLSRASKRLRNITSAWIKEQEVKVGENAQIAEYRVLMKVSFLLED